MRHLTRLISAALLSLGLVAGAVALLATPAQAKVWLAPAADPDVVGQDAERHAGSDFSTSTRYG